ncbi:tyrosine-type recombinase/integrase [Natronosporangium hydrolyticum]|uniref:Tyrosine-type recombinase/integrase n=1 Tax=Natronosporangium hydrolyticum TaxID=2811111 RepID=A0A895YJS8_9ACTN|nr:site-specific integrase [Natronosporangium hydrolyticum]QSB14048.1 tyrosine-type recombinase/integrase [Natronosporangium hydrolyticum]
MPVDDLWYLKKPGPDGKRRPSKRHGQGKRWRVRFEDATGKPSTRFFDRKTDAEEWDRRPRVSEAEQPVVSGPRTTFRAYTERWQTSRQIGQALDYRRHIDARLRHHLYPYFADRPIMAITVTDVLEWITHLMAKNVAQSSIRTYFDLLNMILNAALVDRVVLENPCKAIRLSAILRGVSRAPKWVPTTEDVRALFAVVPDEYRAAVWLGAGAGLRLGEVLGFEDGTRCLDRDLQEVRVVQQLRFHRAEFGGFYLAPPKSGSVGSVDLDDDVAAVLGEHVRKYPPVTVELPDITAGTPDPGKAPKLRAVPLLFTDAQGRPVHDQRWSDIWGRWRRQAGWPAEGTFHSLRHYFATMLITAGADPTDVQRALRHSSLRITLETYVHWWPRKQRRRNIIGSQLRPTTSPVETQDQS